MIEVSRGMPDLNRRRLHLRAARGPGAGSGALQIALQKCAREALAGTIAHPRWIEEIRAFREDLALPRRLDLALTTRRPSG